MFFIGTTGGLPKAGEILAELETLRLLFSTIMLFQTELGQVFFLLGIAGTLRGVRSGASRLLAVLSRAFAIADSRRAIVQGKFAVPWEVMFAPGLDLFLAPAVHLFHTLTATKVVLCNSIRTVFQPVREDLSTFVVAIRVTLATGLL